MKSNGIDLQLWESVKEAVQEVPHRRGSSCGLRTAGWEALGSRAMPRKSSRRVRSHRGPSNSKPIGPKMRAEPMEGRVQGRQSSDALAGCVGLSYVANAINRGVEIDHIEIVIEASADLGSVLEAGNPRPGFSNIEILVKVRSNADEQTLADLGQAAPRTSTVFESLVSPVPLTLTVETIT